ncbi:hypothetical protein CCAX7_20100 [Capsulimonas corticalis]|uniref:Uncharacterized protein n=1 Tax=Capsulimonas corticalis TaxID=2219043 RepID=A0A402D2M1_9BACT|nr:hypothetical protein [Capsulimonas corticalis]BDI29959.1 hypothetical protein CCAX7_20100 [Capsulimonas corticalis]
MRFNRNTIVHGLFASAALGLTVAMAGCGGSSNNGIATPLQITGSVATTPASSSLSGYVVSFDGSKTETVTTNAAGAFTLIVPRTDVGGADVLTVTDSKGVLVDSVTLPASDKSSSSVDAGVLNLSPPVAPFVAAR